MKKNNWRTVFSNYFVAIHFPLKPSKIYNAKSNFIAATKANSPIRDERSINGLNFTTTKIRLEDC
jgi:hypothetical protein